MRAKRVGLKNSNISEGIFDSADEGEKFFGWQGHEMTRAAGSHEMARAALYYVTF